MALDLTPEQKAIGARNFAQAAADLERDRQAKNPADPTRRTFMKVAAAAGAVVPVSAAVYFGYDQWKGNNPVKVALIGCGDEGNILVGDHNKDFTKIVAVCDVRPYNMERIFAGEPAPSPRKGLNLVYGKDEAAKIRRFETVEDLLKAKDELGLEGVILATPLITHRPLTIQCLEAGLHVLCEKLMARTIADCKAMITKAKEKGLLLSIGHQRHYSMLYAHALEVVNSGLLGDIKHIRALWHRNNSWDMKYTDKEKEAFDPAYDLPTIRDGWYPPIRKQDSAKLPQAELDKLTFLPIASLDANNRYAPKSGAKPEPYYTDIKELVRWRISDRTGGGLMAELGSHQLDAASIFLGKVKPIAVLGSGVKAFYGPGKNPRDCEDGVFCTYEFPGPTYAANKQDICVVTYSSISTNGFEDYGECLMGSRGTMIVEKEANVYLFKEKDPGKKGDAGGKDTAITVTVSKDGKPAAEASSTWGGGGGAAISKGPGGPAWDSDIRGYRSEMEHFAYCIRKWQEMKQPVSYEFEVGSDGKKKWKYADILPRCHGEIAMADAILALTANLAMKHRVRIDFQPNWFDPDKHAAGDHPEDLFPEKKTV